MYKKYNRCPPPEKLIVTGDCCPSPASPGPGAVPESVRLASEQCSPMWLTTMVTPTCESTITSVQSLMPTSAGTYMPPTGRIQKIQVPFIPGSPPPYATIQTVAASVTTRQNAITTIAESMNPYNPAMRFSQYFPPQPPPPPCPVRSPSNFTAPSVITCIPITRFKGSSLDE